MTGNAAVDGPNRRAVEIDGAVVRVGGQSARFDTGEPGSLLTTYLVAVRKLRKQRRDPAIVLRSDDVVVLADHLGISGTEVIERLGALMGATRAQRAAMAALFATGALVIGLATTAVAAHGPAGDASGDQPAAVAVDGDLYDSLGVVVFQDADESAPESADATPPPSDNAGVAPMDSGPSASSTTSPVLTSSPSNAPSAAPSAPPRDSAPATTASKSAPPDELVDDPEPTTSLVELGTPPTPPTTTTTAPPPSTGPPSSTDQIEEGDGDIDPVDEVFEEPWLVIDPIVEPQP